MERIAVTFNRSVAVKPCGFTGHSTSSFKPLPVVSTAEPITQIVRMRTLSNGARVMMGVRRADGKRVKQ